MELRVLVDVVAVRLQQLRWSLIEGLFRRLDGYLGRLGLCLPLIAIQGRPNRRLQILGFFCSRDRGVSLFVNGYFFSVFLLLGAISHRGADLVRDELPLVRHCSAIPHIGKSSDALHPDLWLRKVVVRNIQLDVSFGSHRFRCCYLFLRLLISC